MEGPLPEWESLALVALACTVSTGCVICQYTEGRGFAATPAPPRLARGPRRRRPRRAPLEAPYRGRVFTRLGFTRAKNPRRFWTLFQMQFGGRLTKLFFKEGKLERSYDGQECTGIRHIIAARSLDTEKVGHGFKNKFDVCQTESLVQ